MLRLLRESEPASDLSSSDDFVDEVVGNVWWFDEDGLCWNCELGSRLVLQAAAFGRRFAG